MIEQPKVTAPTIPCSRCSGSGRVPLPQELRRTLYAVITAGTMTANELAKRLRLTHGAACNRLAELRKAGFLVVEQVGREQAHRYGDRRAQSLGGVEREWTPAEKFQLYIRGFKDGAGARVQRIEESKLSFYREGYEAGDRARDRVIVGYAMKVGHDVSTMTLLREASES